MKTEKIAESSSLLVYRLGIVEEHWKSVLDWAGYVGEAHGMVCFADLEHSPC
jgi:hypothetical protein